MNDITPKIRLVLVDDWELVRGGLRELLSTRPHFDVVGEAGSAAEAHPLIEREKPDVALIDLEMPGPSGRDPSGLDLCAELHKTRPELHSIIVTLHAEPNYIRKALQAGAHGYILKPWPAARILGAIEAIAASALVFPPVPPHLLWDDLTKREREVAWLIARGYGNAQVAAQLGIKESTVEKPYRRNACEKLQCFSAVTIADYIRENGISECDLEVRPSSPPPPK